MSIDCLNPVVELPASPADERLLTVDELARQFRVSTKTVRRWRRYGLVSRRFLLDGRKRVGFLQSSVDRFLADNEERVHRGARFSRMTDEDRKEIIDRVRCLAQAGGRLTEIAGRIAQETGRSWRRSGTRSNASTRNILTWRSFRTVIIPCGSRRSGDLPAISPWRVGGGVGPAIRSDPDAASTASSTT